MILAIISWSVTIILMIVLFVVFKKFKQLKKNHNELLQKSSERDELVEKFYEKYETDNNVVVEFCKSLLTFSGGKSIIISCHLLRGNSILL